MNEPTFRVFVSSTWRDLGPERAAVRDAVLRMRETRFVGMEYFGSRDETTRRASLDEVDDSRVYVGIIAARYGSGITEAEYRRARERGLPCLIYFKDDAAIPADLREPDPAQTARLDALKAELLREHDVSTFNNPDHLAALLTADLHRLLFSLRGADVTLIPTLHQLRAPVGDFVGREKEIASLLAALRGGASAAITGISGMGGIGKTELAFYVAERLRDTYPDAQLAFDMRGTDDLPRDPADALAACIRSFLGPERRLPDNAEELKRLYFSVLEGKRALLLLDNASDSAQVRPLLPPAGSALLVTSRNAVTLPGMKTRITLDQLSPAEARGLLTGIAPRVPADTADAICQLCGYLPLAVRAAGSLLDVTIDLDPETYVSQLRDERTRLELIGAEGVDVSVDASFNLSYARLSPDAARVFRQLAVFPASFEARAEEAVCEDVNHAHLSQLVRHSLVIYNPDTRRYRFHDLARLFADSLLCEPERGACGLRHAEYYLSVLAECEGFYLRGGEAIKSALPLFDAERRNVEAGREWACRHFAADERAMRLCDAYPRTGAYVLGLRQHPRKRILWLEAALAAARQLKDRAAEGAHLGSLGLAYAALGETRRAIEFHEQALAISREIGNRRGEGSALGSLGNAYADLGEPRVAVGFYEQRLAIARELGDRRGEGNALGSLGNAYADLGEPRIAISFHEQALDIDRGIGNRRGEGQDLDNLGNAYTALGETGRGVEFHEQALAVFRELGDHRGEATVLGNLGVYYKNSGDVRRALEYYERQLEIAREIGDRASEGKALVNIGQSLDRLGERAQAVASVEAALVIYEQLKSPRVDKVRAQLAEWRGEATEGE